MNHNKESQAHASLESLLLGMKSSTFQSRIRALLTSRRVRDTVSTGLPCLRRRELGKHHTVMRLIAWSALKHWLSLNHFMAKRNIRLCLHVNDMSAESRESHTLPKCHMQCRDYFVSNVIWFCAQFSFFTREVFLVCCDVGISTSVSWRELLFEYYETYSVCLCFVCRSECIVTHSSLCGCYRLKSLSVICMTLLPLGFGLGVTAADLDTFKKQLITYVDHRQSRVLNIMRYFNECSRWSDYGRISIYFYCTDCDCSFRKLRRYFQRAFHLAFFSINKSRATDHEGRLLSDCVRKSDNKERQFASKLTLHLVLFCEGVLMTIVTSMLRSYRFPERWMELSSTWMSMIQWITCSSWSCSFVSYKHSSTVFFASQSFPDCLVLVRDNCFTSCLDIQNVMDNGSIDIVQSTCFVFDQYLSLPCLTWHSKDVPREEKVTNERLFSHLPLI